MANFADVDLGPQAAMSALSLADLHLVVRRMPRDVQDALRQNPGLFVGGGFVRAVVGNEEVNDIDFFGPDYAFVFRVAEMLKSRTSDTTLLKTKNAITLASPGRTALQFITRWSFSTPEDLVRSFDFTVCQAAVCFERGMFRSVVGPRFYQDLAAKRLTYTLPIRDEEAGGSMLRVIKYVKRGYRIQMRDLSAVIARVVNNYDPKTSVGLDQFILSRMQEVDPLSVIDGVPVDDDVKIQGLPNG
jgi:hypothetical protein